MKQRLSDLKIILNANEKLWLKVCVGAVALLILISYL